MHPYSVRVGGQRLSGSVRYTSIVSVHSISVARTCGTGLTSAKQDDQASWKADQKKKSVGPYYGQVWKAGFERGGGMGQKSWGMIGDDPFRLAINLTSVCVIRTARKVRRGPVCL